MRTEFDAATKARDTYVQGLQEELLTPMRDRVSEVVTRLFSAFADFGLLSTFAAALAAFLLVWRVFRAM